MRSKNSMKFLKYLYESLSIVLDKCMLSLDRRTIPGEAAENARQEIQKIIDEIKKDDPELEKSYTGMEIEATKDMDPWKTPEDHPFTKACAEVLEAVGQEVKYGYWDSELMAVRRLALIENQLSVILLCRSNIRIHLMIKLGLILSKKQLQGMQLYS